MQIPIIQPTVGRRVLFKPNPVNLPDLVFAADVVAVQGDRCVNLSVFDANGQRFSRLGVVLVQEGDEAPPLPHALWMDYQRNQAVAQAAAAVVPAEAPAPAAPPTSETVVANPTPVPVFDSLPQGDTDTDSKASPQ
jgi:hypothetical protein